MCNFLGMYPIYNDLSFTFDISYTRQTCFFLEADHHRCLHRQTGKLPRSCSSVYKENTLSLTIQSCERTVNGNY